MLPTNNNEPAKLEPIDLHIADPRELFQIFIACKMAMEQASAVCGSCDDPDIIREATSRLIQACGFLTGAVASATGDELQRLQLAKADAAPLN